MNSTHAPIAVPVGSKVPADLRLIELLSNVFRTDQVCSLQLTRTAAAHTPVPTSRLSGRPSQEGAAVEDAA